MLILLKTSLMKKIRTIDLTLEINKVSIEDDTNNKESEHDHIMVTQSGDPNNKSKPALKKYCSYCQKNNHDISNCYQKQGDDEYQRYKNQRSRTPQQSFVQYFTVNPIINKKIEMKIRMTILPKIMTVIDIIKITTMTDAEIRTDTKATVEIIHKMIIDVILDKDTTIDLEAHVHLDLLMTIIIKEELHPDLHIDLHSETTLITDIILDPDIDFVPNHKETPLDDTISQINLHLEQETIYYDLEHPHKKDNKTE